MKMDKTISIAALKRYKFSDNHIAGIYFLFFHNELVYIGQSFDLLKRVDQHYSQKRGFVDSYSYIEVKHKKSRLILENDLIVFYKPRYNVDRALKFKKERRYYYKEKR